MKVKDLIAKLQTLDQEKEICVVYDYYAVDSSFDVKIDECGEFNKKGSYVIFEG